MIKSMFTVRNLVRAVIIAIFLLVVVVVAGIFLLQINLGKLAKNYVQQHYGLALKIGTAELTFYPLSIRLQQIELSTANEPAPFLKADSASAALPYSSFWDDKFVVQEASLDSPVVDLNHIPKSASKTTESSGASKQFVVERLQIKSGTIKFRQYQIHDVDVNSQIDSDGMQLSKLRLAGYGGRASASGKIKDWSDPEADLTYSVSGQFDQLQELYPDAKEIRGSYSTSGKVTGKLSKPVVSGKLDNTIVIFRQNRPFSVKADYRLDTGAQTPLSLDASWDSFPVELIHSYVADWPADPANSSGHVHYTGGWDFVDGSGNATTQITSASMGLTGQLDVSLANQTLQIRKSNFRLRSSSLIASGRLRKDGLAVSAVLQSNNLGDFVRWYRPAKAIPGVWNVTANLSGPYNALQAMGRITGSTQHSRIEANAQVNLKSKQISADFIASTNAHDLQEISSYISDGDFRLSGSLKGNLSNPAIHAYMEGSSVCVADFHPGNLSGLVDGQWRHLNFSVDAVDYKTTINGSYNGKSSDFELHGAIADLTVDKVRGILPDSFRELNGKVSTDFHAIGNAGRWKQATIQVRIANADFQWRDETLTLLPGSTFGLEHGDAHFDVRAHSLDGQTHVWGSVPLNPKEPIDVNLEGNISGSILKKINQQWKADGSAKWNAHLKGHRDRPEGSGSLLANNVSLTHLPSGKTFNADELSVSLDGSRIDLNGVGRYNSANVRWQGSIPLDDSTGTLQADITSISLTEIEPGSPVTGRVDVSIQMNGKGFPLKEWDKKQNANLPFHEWNSSIVITPSDLKFGEYPLVVENPMQLTLQNGTLTLPKSSIKSGHMLELETSGSLNLETGTLQSSTKLSARIDMLSGLNADIQSSGPMTLDVAVSGTITKPTYQGMIRLHDASFRMPNSPLSFEKVELEASIDENRIKLQKFNARSGGGTITGGGEIVKAVAGSSIWLSGKKVALIYPEGLRSQSNCDLKLTAVKDGFVLSGDVAILRSFYDQELTFRNPLLRQLLAKQVESTRDKYLKSKIALAINLHTQDDFVLKNTLAEVRVGGSVKLQGTLYQTRVGGRLQIRQGSRLFVSGKTYVIEKATLDFFGSEAIEPNLDIEISTLTQDLDNNTFYEVFLRIGGSFSSIEFRNVKSNPTLSETQIYNLLTYGTIRTSASQASAGTLFRQQLISAITGQVLSVPASRVARSIGLSRINIQQEGLTSVNDPKTRLVLSKDVGSGFSLIYSFVLNEPQDYTYVAAYRYQNKFFLRYIGQDDGTYTASFNHRIPFGQGASSQSNVTARTQRHKDPAIASLTISNSSPLTEKQIRDLLSVDKASTYDYWDFSKSLDALSGKLQSLGYLSPAVNLTETELEGNRVGLSLEITPGEQGMMKFNGFHVKDKAITKYMKWWAQGISPSVVQQMIQQDLLDELYVEGYQRATVATRSEDLNGKMIYAFDVKPGPFYKTVRLDFQGIQIYSPRELQNSLQVFYPSPGAMFSDAIHEGSDVSEKIRVLYLQRGYAAVTVSVGTLSYDNQAGTIKREFVVQEGKPLQVTQVTVDDGPIPDYLTSTLRIQPGKSITPQDFFDDQAGICNYYENSGHQGCVAKFDFQMLENNTQLSLNWTVHKGVLARIGTVQVIGNLHTKASVITDALRLQSGEPLTTFGQSAAQKRLYDLGVFQQVDIERVQTDSAEVYDVVVSVVENKPYEVQYGARYNTDDKLGAELRLIDYNFLGRAQQLSFYGRSNLDEPLFRIDYILPHNDNFWHGMQFSFFRDKRDDEITGISEGKEVPLPYTIKETQAKVQQSLPIGFHHQVIWDFSFGPEYAKTRDSEIFLESSGVRTLFHTVLIGDYRDDAFDATRGFFYSIDGQAAPSIFGSDIIYDKTYGQFFIYRKLHRIVFASAVRMGFLNARSDNLAVSEKFRSGGSTTMRGFELNAVHPEDTGNEGIFFGGDSVFIINEEMRFPIYKFIHGGIFYDGGNVYTLASDFDPTNIRNSAGFGIRLGSGGFLLRLDLGFNLQPREFESHTVFHFAIGQAF